MPSGPQIRAARALLGISAKELAELAGVGWATVQRYESSAEVSGVQPPKMKQIIKVLEDAGIEFIGDPVSSPGARLRRR